MSRIKISADDLQLIKLFEKTTGARVKDCVHGEGAIGFIVAEGDMGLAIGKNGSKIKKVKDAMKSNIIVVEYSDNESNFLKNIFHPVPVKKLDLTMQDGKKSAKIQVAKKDRGKAIGEGGVKIKMARIIAERHHNIAEIILQTV
ncbi:MAG TPA: NusA-like transcription termination signal-binding factor [Candidatus Altiarchaeales archaeon]|nr:NusA-like transcription termination signal-binding factor [Candidatus Altiarchaeales archaeon]